MMEKFSVVSVNVRGIRADAKRIKIFTQLKEKIHSGIFLFQETHSKIEDEEKWKKEWGSDIFFNHGSSNSRGTLIGFSNNLNIKNCDYKQDSEGRIQLCKFELEEQKYIIVNLYNDNVQSKQIETLKNLEKMIENAQPLENEIIIGGDFNVIPTDEDVYSPENYKNDALFRLEIRKKLRELINLGFHDAYRYIHPDKEGYTFWDYTSGAWQKNNGMRIDHFLVSSSLINIVKNVSINKFPRGRKKPSDHTPIEIELA